MRRDAHSVEEEEAWFDMDEEFEDVDVTATTGDVLRPAGGSNKLNSSEMEFVFGGMKAESDFDQIDKFLERSHSPSGKT